MCLSLCQALSPPLFYSNFMVILHNQAYHSTCSDKETEAQRSQETCPKSHSLSWDLKHHHLLLFLLVGSWPRHLRG